MITCSGSTVKHALNIFRECRGAPIMDRGFTMGTALFGKKFAPDGFSPNHARAVCEWLENTDPSELDKYMEYQGKK